MGCVRNLVTGHPVCLDCSNPPANCNPPIPSVTEALAAATGAASPSAANPSGFRFADSGGSGPAALPLSALRNMPLRSAAAADAQARLTMLELSGMNRQLFGDPRWEDVVTRGWPYVCGSNGQTFPNMCFLHVYNCIARTFVDMVSTGPCPGEYFIVYHCTGDS